MAILSKPLKEIALDDVHTALTDKDVFIALYNITHKSDGEPPLTNPLPINRGW